MKRTRSKSGAGGEWWHGGADGRRPGDQLLPPVLTGHIPIWPAATPSSPVHVYITNSLPCACAHAMLLAARLYPTGMARVYRVLPAAPIEADPERDAGHWSYRCPRAKVIGALDLGWGDLVALAHDAAFLEEYLAQGTRFR